MLLERLEWHLTAVRSAYGLRIFNLVGPDFDDGSQPAHPGPSDEVVRPLLVIAAQSSPLLSSSLDVGAAASMLAGKASEPFQSAWYTLSYIPSDHWAKSSIGSEQMASWFSG